jgi:hypothetical protein
MNEGRIITIAEFDDAMQAEIMRGKLAAAGIPAYVSDGNVLPHIPFFAHAVRLQINEEDEEQAKLVLEG